MGRILVVDDSAAMRLTMKNLLTQCGNEVVAEAEDAPSAIKKYREVRPDCVTMDIIMPEESGLDAVKKIVQFDPNAKIIMVSSLGQEKIVEEAMFLGARWFLVKPVQKRKLEEALKRILP